MISTLSYLKPFITDAIWGIDDKKIAILFCIFRWNIRTLDGLIIKTVLAFCWKSVFKIKILSDS